MGGPTLGVCYCRKHWPEARRSAGAAMMRGAGIDFVRIGKGALPPPA